MDLGQLIKHPEMMDKETLYDLRSLVALYPYYQTARLLMLHIVLTQTATVLQHARNLAGKDG